MDSGTGPTLESARTARLIRTWAGALVAVVAAAGALASSEGVAWAVGEPCTTSAQCTTDPNAPICDSLTGGGCLGGAGACTNTCRKCSSGVECVGRNALTTVCVLDDGGPRAGQCIGCISNAQCQGPTPVCDVGTALCVGCLGSGDCAATGNPVCDQTNHQCVSCQSDFQPNNPGLFSCSNPDLPACQTTTEANAKGQCTQCSSTNPGVCPSKPDAPACDVSKGECGCSSDAQCSGSPGAKTGRVCDPGANGGLGLCVPGCRVVNGVDNCPLGQTCSVQDGGLGTCTGTTCNGDGDCTTAPRTHCDTTTTHTCVECVNDSQCSGGKVCATEPTDPHYGQCVDCTPAKQNNCTTPPNPVGDTCLGSSDTCGCLNDGDCGDAKSGRICDDTGTHQCRPGCRGTGGNGCPDDKDCTSKTHDPGDCNPKTDGGAGDGGGLGDGGGNGDGGENLDAGGNGGNGKFPKDGIVEGGGCACSTIGGGDAGSGLAALFALAFGVAALARRKRNS